MFEMRTKISLGPNSSKFELLKEQNPLFVVIGFLFWDVQGL